MITKLAITNGNQLIAAKTISSAELDSLSFSITVQDDTSPIALELNSLSIGKTFKLNIPSQVDNTPRTEQFVLAPAGDGSAPISFSATDIGGTLSYNSGPTLTTEDFAAITAGLGLKTTTGEIDSITPYGASIEFSLVLDTPGSVARFEFELDSNLSWEKLNTIKYFKQSAAGILSVFEYKPDDFGINQGARLETTNKVALTSANFVSGNPVYLAVYIQDNGFYDDDITFGTILDPGAPIFVTTAGGSGASSGGGGSGSGGSDGGGSSNTGSTTSTTGGGAKSTGSSASSAGNSASSGESSAAISGQPTESSLGIFEVAYSDELPGPTKTEGGNSETLATTFSDVEQVVVVDQDGGGEDTIVKAGGTKKPKSNLLEEIKNLSLDGLRKWAEDFGLVNTGQKGGRNTPNGLAKFMGDRLGINPPTSEGLINAMVLGAAGLYLTKTTGPGVLMKWATGIWGGSVKNNPASAPHQRVIAVFIMRSNKALDRLVAAEVQEDKIEILAEERLSLSLSAAANRSNANLEDHVKSLSLKLENQGINPYDLLLFDPAIKSYLGAIEHLGRDSDEMRSDRIQNVVNSLAQKELELLEVWLDNPSQNPLGDHPIAKSLQKRQQILAKQLSKNKARIASLLELSLAMP